jgi:hypothetical protein
MPHTSPHHLTELHSPLPPPTAVKQQPPNLRVRLARHSLPATRSLLLHRHGHCNRANWSSSISRQQTGGNLLHPRTERGIDRTNLEERQTEPFQTGENKGQARVVMNYSCFLSLPLFPAKSVVSKQRARMSMTASRPLIFFCFTAVHKESWAELALAALYHATVHSILYFTGACLYFTGAFRKKKFLWASGPPPSIHSPASGASPLGVARSRVEGHRVLHSVPPSRVGETLS